MLASWSKSRELPRAPRFRANSSIVCSIWPTLGNSHLFAAQRAALAQVVSPAALAVLTAAPD